jgi:hypothetical protein
VSEEIVYSHIGLRPLKGVFIEIYDTGDKVIQVGGKDFYILTDNDIAAKWHNPMGGTHPGLRSRWAEILAVSKSAYESGLRPGHHVYCEQLKWTRKYWNRPDNGKPMSWIDLKDILGVDEEKTRD